MFPSRRVTDDVISKATKVITKATVVAKERMIFKATDATMLSEIIVEKMW
jgi:hypothetical protein